MSATMAISPGLWSVLAAPFVGSFLGLLVRRLPLGRPVASGRSRCRRCDSRLAAVDLIPVASWVWLRGRCRYCGGAIGALEPAMELAALGVAAWAWWLSPGWGAVAGSALGWTLLTLAVIDQRHFLLPDLLTIPLVPAGLVATALWRPEAVGAHAVGALAGFLAFVGIATAYRRLRGEEGLGLGDAKLLAAGGAWLSWAALPLVVLAAALSAMAAILASSLATGRRVGRRTAVAFGPHLCLGIWLCWALSAGDLP